MAKQSVDTTMLPDGRVACWSMMTGMTVANYLALVEKAYKSRGGIAGQREPLKTTTGKRIRQRMVEDIKLGAVLPPVVIGVVIHGDLAPIAELSADDILDRMDGEWIDSISIIDGMQRTTALREALEEASEVAEQKVRVECWLAQETDSLIYRMLILNTGQVPWNVKRQLSVVYAPLIKEIDQKVKFEKLITLDKPGRRTKGGEFNADSLVDAYLAFGLRRTEIDTQETLAEEFSRLDIADAITSKKFDHYFPPIVQCLVDLDKAFARLDVSDEIGDAANSKYQVGRNIFDGQPARVGFVVACAIAVLGRLGMDKDTAESDAALRDLTAGTDALVARLMSLEHDALSDFLKLDVLRDMLGGQKRSAVGRHERAFFENAFGILIKEQFEVKSMEACWRG